MALAVASGTGAGVGYAAAAWCLGFAGVSAWQVAADLTGPPDPRQRYAAYASGLVGAPLLLGLILAAAPAILGRWGLLPT